MFYPTFEDKIFQLKILLYLDKIKTIFFLKTEEKKYAFLLDPQCTYPWPPNALLLDLQGLFFSVEKKYYIIF